MARKKIIKKDGPTLDESVPIEWTIPENLIRRYANNMIVQRMENEFLISFFETVPPILFGPLEEKKKQAEKVKSIKSVCIASIFVSPRKMPAFIQALQANLDRFIDQLKEEQGETETSKKK